MQRHWRLGPRLCSGFIAPVGRNRKPPTVVGTANGDANDFRLGAIQLIQVEADIWVANIIGQRDVRRGPDGPPVRYEAIEEGLSTLADEAYAMGASIHMPRIGSGLAGGSWHVIKSIVQRNLGDAGIPVVVYDLP